MTCPLCAAIAAGMPITDDTPLPCRARPSSHEPHESDPFHGAVFDAPPGEKTFSEEFVRALANHHNTTTPEQRLAAHAPHVERARAHLARIHRRET